MKRALIVFLSMFAMLWSAPAAADVKVHFQSFNGSVLFGRFPHTFVVFEGTLDNGTKVFENYGFTAKTVSTRILNGPVEHAVRSEPLKYVKKTNRHFSVTVTDAKYRAMKVEIARWRNAPGKYYDLNTRSCIHFVGRMAQMAGLTVSYPKKLLRGPKKWLNHVTGLNPQLGAKKIK